MIEEILKEIAEAEALAEEKRRDSFQKGKVIVQDADARADKMRRDNADQFKAEVTAALAAAEQKSLVRRPELLADG